MDTTGYKGLKTHVRLAKDDPRWITECPSCKMVRAKDPGVAIGSVCIFEEISVDYIGPFPTDEENNSYILNIVYSTTRYCELFATEAASAVIAAHCLLSVVSRCGCFRRMRSDRGSNFVNEVITEFLELFEIQAVLTLAQRPQANAIAERNGGEVTRHKSNFIGQGVERFMVRAVAFDYEGY